MTVNPLTDDTTWHLRFFFFQKRSKLYVTFSLQDCTTFQWRLGFPCATMHKTVVPVLIHHCDCCPRRLFIYHGREYSEIIFQQMTIEHQGRWAAAYAIYKPF